MILLRIERKLGLVRRDLTGPLMSTATIVANFHAAHLTQIHGLCLSDLPEIVAEGWESNPASRWQD